jgi:hypothetical protein
MTKKDRELWRKRKIIGNEKKNKKTHQIQLLDEVIQQNQDLKLLTICEEL